MKPFEKALIQSILDDYDEILKNYPTLQDQNSHGKVEQYFGQSNIDIDKDIIHSSLWIDRESKIIYSTPHTGTKQFFFRDEKRRETCINLLTTQGYCFDE